MQKSTQRLRNFRHVFWRFMCLGLTLLQTNGSWNPWWRTYVWKNGPGLQSHLLTKQRWRGVSVLLCIAYGWLKAPAFGTEIFVLKAGARSHPRHWIRSIMYKWLDLQKIKESISLPGCWHMVLDICFVVHRRMVLQKLCEAKVTWAGGLGCVLPMQYSWQSAVFCSHWFPSVHFWVAMF